MQQQASYSHFPIRLSATSASQTSNSIHSLTRDSLTVLLDPLHRVLLSSCNFRLLHREAQFPERDLAEDRRKKKEGTKPPVPDLSIDRSVCSFRTFCSFPRETFAVKPFPFACAFSNIPSLIRSVLFPRSSPAFPLLSSIFRLRASTTPLPRFHFASYRLPPFLPKPKDSPRPFLSRPADTTNRRRWGKEIAGKASSFS